MWKVCSVFGARKKQHVLHAVVGNVCHVIRETAGFGWHSLSEVPALPFHQPSLDAYGQCGTEAGGNTGQLNTTGIEPPFHAPNMILPGERTGKPLPGQFLGLSN